LAPVDIAVLLEDVVSEVKMLAAGKEITVLTSLPEDMVHSEVDESSFRRMLLILLDNAIKYTAPGGKLTIRVTQDGRQVAIAVADTGTGIPANELPFVFDRFWRADKVRSRDAGGTGLGLAIAREIAQAHGAELTAESSVGQGSTFTVRLRRPAGQPPTLAVSSERSV
jgi:signal transduction histidine kinase